MKTNEISASASSSRSDMLRDVREKKAAHTFGLWAVSNPNDRSVFVIRRAPSGGVIARTAISQRSIHRAEGEAIARLIAAAPDLLSALKAILADDGGNGSEGFHSGKLFDARTAGFAAIAKALGIDQALERADGGE